ncbi:unnamed protein product [Alternaria burnsii]|nr:unnamed protein product [Alternaria burnsii]
MIHVVGDGSQLNYLMCPQMNIALSHCRRTREGATWRSNCRASPPHPLVRNLDNTTSTALFAAPLPASIIHILNSRRTCCLEMMIGLLVGWKEEGAARQCNEKPRLEG